ncbi:MAG TPA: MerR family transcriptional regulator [Gaiellaceae bacterium]|nr:MerR family transcriptional regulator [Gaiellaceae bacterium]
MNVGRAATQTGWSPRMLRYIEQSQLVVPPRTASGYRSYGLREVNQLRSLRDLLGRFKIELADLVFAARLRRDSALRAAVDAWLAGVELDALEWEQRKHERLLAA